jgi:hypothetical protein
MKSSFRSLIPFLPLFCKGQFRRPDSVQFLCSQAHILAGWCLETRLNSSQLNYFSTSTLHGPRRKHSLSIVVKECLQCRCIAMEVARLLLRIHCRGNVSTESLPNNVYTDFIIPAFRRHVTVFKAEYPERAVYSLKEYCV